MSVHVTAHAAARYVERIDATLTNEEAHARIMQHAGAIQVAADFGCRCVRTGIGAKLILVGDRVVTVIERGWIARDCLPFGDRI